MSFGDNRSRNYDDKTMLNEYPQVIHKDKGKSRLEWGANIILKDVFSSDY